MTRYIIAAVVLSCAVSNADEPKLHVSVELRDGSRLIGTSPTKTLMYQSGHELLPTPLNKIVAAESNKATWTLHLERDVDKPVTAKLVSESIQMQTLVGEVTVPLREVTRFMTYEQFVPKNIPARSDLVVYLDFDRNSGKWTRNQASFHHGKVKGAKWIKDGRRGGAYEFDGNQASIEIPHHDDLCPKALTLSAWIKPKKSEEYWKLLITKTDVSSWFGGYGFCKYSGDANNLYFYAGNYSSGAAKQPIHAGEWIHVCGVFDGKQVQMFVNGEPSLPVTIANNYVRMSHTGTPFIIGGGGSYNWAGAIDEVMLYRRALKPTEVEELVIAGLKSVEDD